MEVLSIQSSVAYGHVGNSAAVFPLQRLGHEVWPVLTVHFSNHTGYGAWRGPLLDPADVREVIAGIDDRGALAAVDAVLSGYQGDPAVGAVILDAVARVQVAQPGAVYCCDPVMGDVGRGMFVRQGIPEFMRDTVVPGGGHPHAQPLRARLPRRDDDRRRWPRCWPPSTSSRSRGPRDVLVTSVLVDDTPADSLDVVAVSDARAPGRSPLPCCRSRPTAAATSRRRSTSRHLLNWNWSPAHGPGAHDVVASSRSSRRPCCSGPARSSWSRPRR